ncbi:MAG: hypothetical protein NT031_12080, partial [Planctomycetota bacterium]|nr:hypothetical protein [Planctomycetota bacterium]
MEFLNEPTKSKSIRREMDRARRRLVSDDLARELADAIGKTNTYDRLEDNDATYVIHAGGAKVDAKGVVALTPAPGAAGEPPMIRVQRTPKPSAPGQPPASAETIVAPFAEVASEWQAWSSPKLYISAMRGNKPPEGSGLYIVRMELYGDAKTPVTVTDVDHVDHPSRLPRWIR